MKGKFLHKYEERINIFLMIEDPQTSIIQDIAYFNRMIGELPKASYSEMGKRQRYKSGLHFPLLNGLMMSDPEDLDASAEWIRSQKEFFGTLPHIVWLVSPEQREVIGPRLEAEGYHCLGPYTGMCAEFSRPLPRAAKTEVEVIEVTAKDYGAWIALMGQVFGIDGVNLEAFAHIFRDFGPERPFCHLLARYEGKPVGTLSLFRRGPLCNASNGAVLPEARKLGAGRALGRAFIELARSEGYSQGTTALMESALARGLCGKFGARPVSELYPYFCV